MFNTPGSGAENVEDSAGRKRVYIIEDICASSAGEETMTDLLYILLSMRFRIECVLFADVENIFGTLSNCISAQVQPSTETGQLRYKQTP